MDYYFVSSNDLSIFNSILATHFPNLSYNDLSISDLVLKDLRILIADHNELGQMVAQVIFKKLGYEVDIAPNASCLENQLDQKKYDIIFIDLKFPPDDGFEIVKTLREKSYKIPIIAMTATLTRENLKHISDCGMNGYLSKPLNPDNIRHILVKWFS
jgi:CheY-like chemotaxis protein